MQSVSMTYKILDDLDTFHFLITSYAPATVTFFLSFQGQCSFASHGCSCFSHCSKYFQMTSTLKQTNKHTHYVLKQVKVTIRLRRRHKDFTYNPLPHVHSLPRYQLMGIRLPQHHLLKALSLLHCIASAPFSNIVWLYLLESISGLSSIDLFVCFSSVSHCLNHYSFTVCLEVR